MDFGHYTDCTVVLAVDLVNTLPDSDGVDRLADVAALRDFLTDHDLSGIRSVDERDLRAAKALRQRLHTVFHASDARTAAATLNDLIADVGALPRLTEHDGEPFHFHFEAPGASLGDRLQVETAMGLANVIVNDGLARLKCCAKPGCEDVFVDTSKNRSRRFCDPAICGNAYHVAAHRARRRKSSTSKRSG